MATNKKTTNTLTEEQKAAARERVKKMMERAKELAKARKEKELNK